MASAKNPFCITASIFRMEDGTSLRGLRQDGHCDKTVMDVTGQLCHTFLTGGFVNVGGRSSSTGKPFNNTTLEDSESPTMLCRSDSASRDKTCCNLACASFSNCSISSVLNVVLECCSVGGIQPHNRNAGLEHWYRLVNRIDIVTNGHRAGWMFAPNAQGCSRCRMICGFRDGAKIRGSSACHDESLQ